MAAKELAAPLLQGTVSLNVSPQRFLSDSHYRSALRNFHKYDAGLWASTIRLQVNPFMLFPFTALVGFCLLLTALLVALKETSMPGAPAASVLPPAGAAYGLAKRRHCVSAGSPSGPAPRGLLISRALCAAARSEL